MPDTTPSSVTQIPGVFAAHATLAEGGTGCTVIVCPRGATGAVDVRGGSPATRETDLLRPEETVQVLNAVVLSGGSAYGLAASCGVADELERQRIGLNVGAGVVPIVSSACLFDLPVGDFATRPGAAEGAAATRLALASPGVALARGCVGAGTGCTVGKLAGPERAMKSGLGECVLSFGSLLCGAVSAVNALGNVCDPDTGAPIAGTLSPDGTRVVDACELLVGTGARSGFAKTAEENERANAGAPSPAGPAPRTNTTISCVVTNARLTKAQATKVAQMSADAYAHAIRPTHTTSDGDTVFVMATGDVEAAPDVVGVLATRALELAIADAARSATGAYGLKAARDLA